MYLVVDEEHIIIKSQNEQKKTKYFQVDERTTTKDETSKRLPISKEVYKKSLPLRMDEIQ